MEPPRLIRALGRWDLTALGFNVIVGSGIFGLPSQAFGLSGVLSPAAFVGAGAVCGLIALCHAEVASRFAQTGGPYLFARSAFGPLIGFEVGWLRWVSGVTALAANATLLVEYAGRLLPAVTYSPWHLLGLTTAVIVPTAINVWSIKKAAAVGNGFALSKLLVLGGFVCAGIIFIDPKRLVAGPLPGFATFSASVLLLMYTFGGFESVTIPTGESGHPQRDVTFALAAGVATATICYVMVQIVCIGTLPRLASSQTPLADAAAVFLGSRAGTVVALSALVVMASNVHSNVLAMSRVLFAMAEQRQLPDILAATHERFSSPHIAILVTSATTLLLVLSGTFIYLVTLSVATRVLIYISTCAALLVFRKREPVPPPVRIPLGSMVAILSLLLCAWLLSITASNQLRDTGIAVGIGLMIFSAAGSAKVTPKGSQTIASGSESTTAPPWR